MIPEQQELPRQQRKPMMKIKRRKNMKTIAPEVLAGYNAGVEKGRLHKGLGLIEFARSKELIYEFLPPPPAVIYDIGGGYGEYACDLAAHGYEVHLFDLSETHILMARELEKERGVSLASAQVADARAIPRPDASADAILLMGPMYHIVDWEERLLCLKECLRLLKSNGLLFTAAITCYATTLWAVTHYEKNSLLDEGAFQEMLATEVTTGHHIKNPASTYHGIGRSYFHHPDTLRAELALAGFPHPDLRGVIGPCWLIPNLEEAWKDPKKRENILKIVRLLEKEESILGLSTHLLCISKKP